ncbi:MFS transporter [Enterococcus sp. HY326]|uniref:MFS transporter n=1 Tax=Enterococcus sp. HY326 TaxID=2971265 RepID=UPI00223F7091|nr:MFS transporter [Enterococcus sp. HY326]
MQQTKTKSIDMVLPIILLSYFMILLDNSIIFTGTVKIAEDLGLNQMQLSWVSNAYSLTFGGMLLFGGRAGDIFGRKRMYQIGLVIFALGSLFVGLAGNAGVIITARAFQGIGSAILAPTTLAILMDNYQGEARTKAVVAYGSMAGIGTAFGLIIGGMLASLFTWRDGFFINVPVSILMFILSAKFIHERETEKGKIDFLGYIVSVIGMIALVYSIVGEAYNLISFIIAVLFLGFFIYHEAKTAAPIMPLSLFKNKERLGAYISRFTFLGSMLTLWFLTPQMMQNYFGYSPLLTGVAFFPVTVAIFISALQVPRLTKLWDNTKLMIIGLITTAIGLGSLALFNGEIGYWFGIAIPMVILGIGQGFTLSPLTAAGIAHTSAEEAGAAAGVVNMVHQIGGSVGLSIVVALSAGVSDLIASYQLQMTIATVFVLISLLSAIFLVRAGTKRK